MDEGILIYDIETKTFGKPDSDKDILKVFGCYSYITKRYYILTNTQDIQVIVNKHKYLVGFNIKSYDNPILKRAGIKLDYKYLIDLREVFKKRAGEMKVGNNMLKDVLMTYSLDFITKTIKLVSEDTSKMKIDYDIFKKDTWTKEELEEITDYTKRDIEVTKKLYEWCEDYFSGFKAFINEDDIKAKRYITDHGAAFSYKAICKAMNWEPTMSDQGKEVRLKGGYVSYPAGESFKGNIYCLDFNCLVEGTKIKMWRDCLQFYDKNIENLKQGDFVMNMQGKQEVDIIRKSFYEGDIFEIELINGKKIKCTPNHVFPVLRNNKLIEVQVKDILETDDLFTRLSKRGKFNGHFKGGKISKRCSVCNKWFKIYPSQDYINGCSTKCSNVLRSRNSKKINLGKNKFNCEHFRKMSIKRKGKKRSVLIKKSIAEGSRISVQNGYNKAKYLYKGTVFRSENELKVAQALDRDSIKWEYESKVFILDKEDVYTPDFYLPELDKWLEVKGSLILDTKKGGYRKFKKFIKHYPNSVLINNENFNNIMCELNDENKKDNKARI